MQRKLMSPKDTYLGVITYPDAWETPLTERGILRQHFGKPPTLEQLLDPEGTIEQTIRVWTLILSRGLRRRDCVYIEGITLEEFEGLPGCSFSPSATYLRSVLG